ASAFFGLGEVAPAWSEFNSEDLLLGGGVGLRFNLAKQDRINLRADVSYGVTGGGWVRGLGSSARPPALYEPGGQAGSTGPRLQLAPFLQHIHSSDDLVHGA